MDLKTKINQRNNMITKNLKLIGAITILTLITMGALSLVTKFIYDSWIDGLILSAIIFGIFAVLAAIGIVIRLAEYIKKNL